MGRKQQLSFLKASPKEFGGSLRKGNPKGKRPLPVKGTLHLVLKSKRAFGARSMLAKTHVNQIDRIVHKQAAACGVKIYHFVNVGNHLHLVVKIHNRDLYRVFIRAVSGLIARQVLKRERGPQKLPASGSSSGYKSFVGKSLSGKSSVSETSDYKTSDGKTLKNVFWVARPFTRLVAWGRDYRNISSYMQKNRVQASRIGPRVSETLGSVVPGFDTQNSLLSTA